MFHIWSLFFAYHNAFSSPRKSDIQDCLVEMLKAHVSQRILGTEIALQQKFWSLWVTHRTSPSFVIDVWFIVIFYSFTIMINDQFVGKFFLILYLLLLFTLPNFFFFHSTKILWSLFFINVLCQFVSSAERVEMPN